MLDTKYFEDNRRYRILGMNLMMSRIYSFHYIIDIYYFIKTHCIQENRMVSIQNSLKIMNLNRRCIHHYYFLSMFGMIHRISYMCLKIYLGMYLGGIHNFAHNSIDEDIGSHCSLNRFELSINNFSIHYHIINNYRLSDNNR